MKRFIGIFILAIIVTFTGQHLTAQNYKFAHISSEELIRSFPETDSANAKFEKLQKELQNQLEIQSVEFNTKYEAYNKEAKNLSELVKKNKEQELADMQKRIQDFQQQAQQQLQDKRAELFQPIVAKANKAIKDVGKEQGFIYVFDTSSGQLPYIDETKSTNLLAFVKTKLGLK